MTPTADDCCAAPTPATARRRCPRCDAPGQSVERITVAAISTGVAPVRQGYRLCRDPRCGAVYFGDDGTVLEAADLHLDPGFQSRSPDALVCYCFHYRRGDIEAELAAQGKTTVAARITAQVKAGNCACEVRNPSGRCCLGEVQRVIGEIRSSSEATLQGEDAQRVTR